MKDLIIIGSVVSDVRVYGRLRELTLSIPNGIFSDLLTIIFRYRVSLSTDTGSSERLPRWLNIRMRTMFALSEVPR